MNGGVGPSCSPTSKHAVCRDTFTPVAPNDGQVLQAGTLIDARFRVERELASGAMGVVYRARDVLLERDTALKVLVGASRNVRDRLRREAAALATLRHEHVVQVYTFGDHEGAPYFAMEFVDGRALSDLIDEHYVRHTSPVALFRAVQILRELGEGLTAVHAAGLVHRDVKPHNVVVENRTGRSVLVDFGAAKLVSEPYDGTIIGTPHYLAPEVIQGQPPTPRADIYSLGRVPFEATTLGQILSLHQRAPIPRPSSIRAELAPVDDLIERMLQKNPADRTANGSLIRHALDDLIAGMAREPKRDEPVSESTVLPGEQGLRVLVVDDDPAFARLAARAAQIAFAEVQASVSRAGSGEAALANAARKRPDIIVLDYLLPDMNGVEILSRIRSGSEGFHPEILVVSSTLARGEQWRFSILGVRDFLAKPIAFPDLVTAIHELGKRRGWSSPT